MRHQLLIVALPLLLAPAANGQGPDSHQVRVQKEPEALIECIRRNRAEDCVAELRQLKARLSPEPAIGEDLQERARQIGADSTFCTLLELSLMKPPLSDRTVTRTTLGCIQDVLDGYWDKDAAEERVRAAALRGEHIPNGYEINRWTRGLDGRLLRRFAEQAGECAAEAWLESGSLRGDHCFQKSLTDLWREMANVD